MKTIGKNQDVWRVLILFPTVISSRDTNLPEILFSRIYADFSPRESWTYFSCLSKQFQLLWKDKHSCFTIHCIICNWLLLWNLVCLIVIDPGCSEQACKIEGMSPFLLLSCLRQIVCSGCILWKKQWNLHKRQSCMLKASPKDSHAWVEVKFRDHSDTGWMCYSSISIRI